MGVASFLEKVWLAQLGLSEGLQVRLRPHNRHRIAGPGRHMLAPEPSGSAIRAPMMKLLRAQAPRPRVPRQVDPRSARGAARGQGRERRVKRKDRRAVLALEAVPGVAEVPPAAPRGG